jgi:hypothetical protein
MFYRNFYMIKNQQKLKSNFKIFATCLMAFIPLLTMIAMIISSTFIFFILYHFAFFFLSMMCIFILFVVHAVNGIKAKQVKNHWLLLIIICNVLAYPFYWYYYILKNRNHKRMHP